MTAILLLLLMISSILFPTSCVKEEDFSTDTSLRLNFSPDTVTFDTVFTTLGSITKQVLVYNPSDKAVKILSITLGGGVASAFRINVDGDTSSVVKEVEIAPQDYLYIFVTVTINPNKRTNPFLVHDSIIFNFNSKQQYLQLMAFGQNAIYHYSPDGFTIADCSQPWTAGLPHVIYGDCLIESGNTLSINEGTHIYFANKSSLIVKKNASLKMQGRYSNEIVLTSMRSDAQYKNLAGQWNNIHLEAGSFENIIDWSVIRNGTIGVLVDSLVNMNPTLKITNTIIENMSDAGIVANTSNIYGTNLLIDNCQRNTVSLTGGSYQFLHCTFTSYWNLTLRRTPSLYIANYKLGDSANTMSYALDKALFGNCIIYGNQQEELGINIKDEYPANYLFDHCSLRSQKYTANNQYFDHCQINKDPLFDSIQGYNYRLKPNSPAATGADVSNPIYSPLVPFDLDNKDRSSVTNPSLGAYQVK